MSFPILMLDNVFVRFDDRVILHNISMTLHRSKITTIIGPNGAGKSTLVRIITGLIKPTSGKVTKPETIQIGYVPQKLKLNDAMPLDVKRFLQLNQNANLTIILEALELTGAAHLVNANMHSLSGGEMQRVLISNAIMKKPDLLVLDEPVQGVDVNGQLDLYRLIVTLKEKLNCAVLMVSHDLHLVMAKTDEVICLSHHICCSGSPDAISEHPEYKALFGEREREHLALYHHHHNHEHDLSGNKILPNKKDGKNA